MTICSAPAHAGHWIWTATGSASLNGQVQFNQTWVAPTTQFTGGLFIPQLKAGQGMPPYNVPGTVSASADLTVTLTGTWTADANSDNTPPPGVLFAETSSAQGVFSDGNSLTQVGQANDGFSDPQVPFGSLIGTSSTNGAKYVKSSGGSITATLTLSASASGTQPAYVGGGASASVGPATISIHAQPYNFRSGSFVDASGATHPAVVTLDCTPKVRQKVRVVYSERETTDYEPQTPYLYQRL